MNAFTVAQIQAAVADGSLTTADALAELTRRIDKRAAAGKHPMVHVVAFRDSLIGA